MIIFGHHWVITIREAPGTLRKLSSVKFLCYSRVIS
jgi:hypothetical protein